MITVLRDIVRVLAMPCREHTKLFSRQLDEPLPRGVAIGLWLHVRYCGGCARFRKQIRRLRELTLTLGRQIETGEQMPDAVRQRVLRRAAEGTEKI